MEEEKKEENLLNTEAEEKSGSDETNTKDCDIANETDSSNIEQADGVKTEETETEDQDISDANIPKQLIAVYPILFESRQYNPGDRLPAHNRDMNEAWVENGAAKWKVIEAHTSVKANMVTAQPGLSGAAILSSGDDLAGQVPKRTSGKGRRGGKK